MKPLVRYTTTSDGVSIAYVVAGEGFPAVAVADPPCSHVQLEWNQLPNSLFDESMAAGRMLVRYDSRGLGLSDRDVADLSLAGRVRDLEAVVQSLALERFALVGTQNGAPVAIAFAVEHPKLVSHLVLIDGVFRGGDFFERTPQFDAMAGMLARDWVMYTENLAALAFGWGRDETRRYGEFVRACVTQQGIMALYGAMARTDVTSLLSLVLCPTLLIHHTAIGPSSVERGRILAANIPDSRLTFVEGGWLDGWDEVTVAIDDFLGDVPEGRRELEKGSREEPKAPSDLRTVLFTDLVGHTEMMSRLGDERGRDVLREHERITREVLKANGGTEVKTMGDGFMASFGSVTKAVECAVALQRAFADREGEPLSVRVGLNAGEPIEEDGDLFGATVILASRIAAKADGGEILVADTVRGLCSGKGFLFADRGDFVAKGIEEPVRISEVRWRE